MGETRSSIVDLPLTSVSDGDLVTVAAWHDNEFGYAMPLAPTVAALADALVPGEFARCAGRLAG